MITDTGTYSLKDSPKIESLWRHSNDGRKEIWY